ncbi:MAG: DUF389 domain-containing protein [Chloroherpetonaceae bacterium]|nr:DUF389 domain-containing protein [Chloroherpetonaceae bacterium]
MIRNIFRFISLQVGEEKKELVLEEVKNSISFRNSTLWILACAIFIASIGLNVNSTAVIIGAMLISPLMGPIVGAGFALATFDFALFRRALKNLAIATVVSLTVSALYFFLSPFKETQSELLARTSPNIYDVMIAFIGGLVGAISITRVSKGNPIPGVAIATALMPPLCTAGYGLAIGNAAYFFGALYLYLINCFFIGVATLLIAKLLRYPPVEAVDERRASLVRRVISILLIVLIAPSVYLAYDLYQEKKILSQMQRFIDEEFLQRGYAILYQKLTPKGSPKTIELALYDKKFSETEFANLQRSLERFGLSDASLILKQNTRDLKGEILKEISAKDQVLSKKQIELDSLRQRLSEYTFDTVFIQSELRILFPEIASVSMGKHALTYGSYGQGPKITFLYSLNESREKGKKAPPFDEAKLRAWLSLKVGGKPVSLVRLSN